VLGGSRRGGVGLSLFSLEGALAEVATDMWAVSVLADPSGAPPWDGDRAPLVLSDGAVNSVSGYLGLCLLTTRALPFPCGFGSGVLTSGSCGVR
jgi:hypothetical protein